MAFFFSFQIARDFREFLNSLLILLKFINSILSFLVLVTEILFINFHEICIVDKINLLERYISITFISFYFYYFFLLLLLSF